MAEIKRQLRRTFRGKTRDVLQEIYDLRQTQGEAYGWGCLDTDGHHDDRMGESHYVRSKKEIAENLLKTAVDKSTDEERRQALLELASHIVKWVQHIDFRNQ